jgi:hypothetical protein
MAVVIDEVEVVPVPEGAEPPPPPPPPAPPQSAVDREIERVVRLRAARATRHNAS